MIHMIRLPATVLLFSSSLLFVASSANEGIGQDNAVPQNPFAHEPAPVLPAALGSPDSEPQSPRSVDQPQEARRLTRSKELQAEARRIRAEVRDIKQLISSRLAVIQGSVWGVPKVVLGNSPPAGDGLTGPIPGVSYPEKMSLGEEEWIVLAGQLRDTNSVEYLLNRISSLGNVHMLSRVVARYPDRRPAFYWLCQIGLPACQPALRRIPLESDGLIRAYLVGLLQTVAGDNQARSWLVALKKTCGNDEQLERVTAAIEQCDDGPCPRSIFAYHKAKLVKTEADAAQDVDE